MSDIWYEAVGADSRLTQGDLILNCPIITWKTEIPQVSVGNEVEDLEAAVQATITDVIVMTQACDLENDKVSNVILCPHFSISDYKQDWEEEMRTRGQNPTAKAWKRLCDDISDGFCWNLSMLNSGESQGLSTEHRIVDFHDVFTVPRSFLESLLKQRGEPRLRLLPPYKEHLSQAFARFFMRVGLPVSVSKIW